MQKISDIFKQSFNVNGLSLTDVQQRLQTIPQSISVANRNPLATIIPLNKVLNREWESFAKFSALMEGCMLCQISPDESLNSPDILSGLEIICEHLPLAVDPSLGLFTVAYAFRDAFPSGCQVGTVGGVPVYWKYYAYTSSRIGGVFMTVGSDANPTILYDANGLPTNAIVVVPDVIRSSQIRALSQSGYAASVLSGEGVISASGISDAAANGEANYTFLSNLLGAASADGRIAIESVNRFCDSYGSCSASLTVRDAVMSMSSGGTVSVLTVISKALDGATKDTYQEGESYYSPLSAPVYTEDIVSTVVNLVASTVAIVLGVVFKGLAAVISLVFTVLSNALGALYAKIGSTVITVTRETLLPVFNKPISAGFGHYSSSSSLPPEILQAVQECGSVGISGVVPGMVIWIFPTSATEYFCQPLIDGWLWQRIDSTNLPEITHSQVAQTYKYTFSASQMPSSLTFSNEYDVYGYLTGTDEQQRVARYQTLASLMLRIAHARTVRYGETISDIVLQYPLIPERTVGDLITDVLNGSDNVATKLASVAQILLTEAMDNNGTSATSMTLWEHLDSVLESYVWYNAVDQYIKVDLIPTLDYDLVTANGWLLPGNECATPAIEWPKMRYSTLIAGVVVSSLIALTATAGILMGKKALKTAATKRLATSEQVFNAAKDAYLKNPTPANGAALTKANRKLTRAWKFGSKVGLTMYNGFETGSSTTTTALASSQEEAGAQASQWTELVKTAVSAADGVTTYDELRKLLIGS